MKDEMNIALRPIAAALAVALITVGCATAPSKPLVNPPTAMVDGKLVSGTLVAMCDKPSDCKMFELQLENKTDQVVEIDWNRSYYLNNGKPDGGLYFDGIVIAQRNNVRPPDVILARSSFKRSLVPSNNFQLVTFPLARWDVKALAGQSHGVYLALKSGAQEETVNVSVNIAP